MSIRCYSILVLVPIGLQMLAAGQSAPAQSTGGASNATRSVPAGALSGIVGVNAQSEDESSEDLPHIPAMLGGQGRSLAFGSEMERSNYLRGGISVGAGYDDNAFLGPGGQVGNTTFSVFPNIAIEQSTSRTQWSLGYAGGFTVNQRLSNRNQGSHVLRFDSGFRLSPHVNLRVAEDFSLTAGIFGASTGTAFQPGPGGSNTNLITPLANQRSSATVGEADYHFALKDLVGASGSFYDLHYSDVTTPGTLVDTRTAAGSAFWLHQIVRRDWAGISYRFQRLTFDPNGETRVHAFTVTNTLNISKTFTVSAFIGPEHSDNHGVAASGPDAGQVSNFGDWSMAGGVEGGWQDGRTGVTAGYSRQVSDGSGVLGAVRLQNIHAAVRRELIPGWAATFGATYGSNGSLTLASSANATSATSIKTTSVGATLERNIGRSLGFQIGYVHDFQNQSGASDINRNRFSATLSYQWAKPLGR
ncbi:MAG TPA: hypothetical protein VEK84_11115 [Terriglobales bacterium]|nr:hypothetical protein [Terriglobales bacterium]